MQSLSHAVMSSILRNQCLGVFSSELLMLLLSTKFSVAEDNVLNLELLFFPTDTFASDEDTSSVAQG